MTLGQQLPRYGTLTASEIYSAVGEALSWWESSEDQLFGLFKALSDDQPERIRSYGAATCNVRMQMLDKAIRTNVAVFRDGELSKLELARAGLKSLVSKRNEISHGYCSSCTFSDDTGIMMQGHFLISAMNEQGPMERPTDMRFALTAADIQKFIKELRLHRGVVQDAWLCIMIRVQDERHKAAGYTVTYAPGHDPSEQSFAGPGGIVPPVPTNSEN